MTQLTFTCPAHAGFHYRTATKLRVPYRQEPVVCAADFVTIYALVTIGAGDPRDAGLLFLTGMAANALADVAVGCWLDRYPCQEKPVAATGLLVAATAFTLTMLAAPWGPGILFAATLVFRVSYSACDIPHNALFSRLASTPSIAIRLSRLRTLGTGIAAALVGLRRHHMSGRAGLTILLLSVSIAAMVSGTLLLPLLQVDRAIAMGPFELLEARCAIEREASAIAASRIMPERLAELRECLTAMASNDVIESEAADERFHMTIAHASENSGLVAALAMLFEARHRSPQYQLMSRMAIAAGVTPRVDEHALIFAALEKQDGKATRAAMRRHLARVLDGFMDTTSAIEIQRIQAIASDQRKRYRLQG